MTKFQTWEELKEQYPDTWLILDAQYNEDEALLGGIVIDVCTDETIDDAIIKYRDLGKDYLHIRTTTYFNNGVQILGV